MGALIGMDRLNVAQRFHRLVLKLNAIAAHSFSRQLTNLSTISCAFRFRHGDPTDCHRVFVLDRLLVHLSDVHAEQDRL